MLEDISTSSLDTDKNLWDYRLLFNSRAALYRTMLVISIAFIGQV